MQVLISYTLNITEIITKEELYKKLSEESPMELKKGQPFEVSTERWDII